MCPLMTKPTKWHLRPAKTQISLGMCPVWSESSLSAWSNIGSSATHGVHCEDWSDLADAQADPSLCWAHRSFWWFCHKAAQIMIYDQLLFVPAEHRFQQFFSHIMTVSVCDRELNAHFYSAASLKYHAPDTWHDTTPSHIILILGQPVLALPHKTSVKRGAASIRKDLWYVMARDQTRDLPFPGYDPLPTELLGPVWSMIRMSLVHNLYKFSFCLHFSQKHWSLSEKSILHFFRQKNH